MFVPPSSLKFTFFKNLYLICSVTYFCIIMTSSLVFSSDNFTFIISLSPKTGGGGGSNIKKDHAAGKNPRCPLSFLFFFKTPSKSTFLCRV